MPIHCTGPGVPMTRGREGFAAVQVARVRCRATIKATRSGPRFPKAIGFWMDVLLGPDGGEQGGAWTR